MFLLLPIDKQVIAISVSISGYWYPYEHLLESTAIQHQRWLTGTYPRLRLVCRNIGTGILWYAH